MAKIKDDIVRDVMAATDIDHKTAKKLIEALLGLIKSKLALSDGVMVSGFGEFKTRHKQARKGRNPKTQVEYEISERTVVTFHLSRVFRKVLNQD